MRALPAFALWLVVGTPSALAQPSATDLGNTAVEASISLMSAALLCRDVLGQTYMVAARSALEATYRAGGMSKNDIIIAADDAEQALRKQQGDQSALDLIDDETTAAEVDQSCRKTVGEALRAAEVANARFAKASGYE